METNHLLKIINLQETIIRLLEAEVARLKTSQTVTISSGVGSQPITSPYSGPYVHPYPGVIPGTTTPIINPQWYTTCETKEGVGGNLGVSTNELMTGGVTLVSGYGGGGIDNSTGIHIYARN